MRLTVLGGCGAWPAAGQACSGYLVEHDGFRLLMDPGYATVPRLLGDVAADQVDGVWVSHGHPDHCADLNPLLRARALRADPPPALPLWAPPGALDAVLALDRPGMLDAAYTRHEVTAGTPFEIGPLQVTTRPLPHFVPNLGVRLEAGGTVLVYTGDTGPSPDVVALAREADLLLAESTHVDGPEQPFLSTARVAGRQAAEAAAQRLVLTHLWPGTDPAAAAVAAAESYRGPIDVARAGLVVDLAA